METTDLPELRAIECLGELDCAGPLRYWMVRRRLQAEPIPGFEYARRGRAYVALAGEA